MAGRVRVGCAGWSYEHWRGCFYPRELPQRAWFAHYARVFDTVEINSSFYRLPSEAAVRQWAEQAPERFLFAAKVSRFITHMKKLKDCEWSLHDFLERMAPLGAHLGPLLYQLPPKWGLDLERLRRFLECLPARHTHVFEFRHPSWLAAEVYDLLARHDASLCVHDMPYVQVPRLAVGRAAYVRFHGTLPGYSGRYPESVLHPWARWLREQARSGRSAFAYFNNDAEGNAVRDAQTLRRLVEG